MMIQLPNGCRCSQPKVNPSQWKTVRASMKKPWYIAFRFYDPARLATHPKGKLVLLKGMNDLKELRSRQLDTQAKLDTLLHMLTVEGWNPITGKSVAPVAVTTIVDPFTPFLLALRTIAKELTSCSSTTKRDIESTLGFVATAALQLRISELPIGHTSRKHIKAILQQIEKNRAPESPHRFNKNRSNLMMLFKELMEFEAVDNDPVSAIKKKVVDKKLRCVLNKEERRRVNNHLKANYYTFWRFAQIFFHSGARLTEMLNLRAAHVDMDNQVFKLVVKKGKSSKEVLKPIKDIVLTLWQEIMATAKTGDALFSKDLKPGSKVIRYEQITRRWKEHVKKKLGIGADFYSLKHLNLDETAEMLSIDDAASAADHSSKVVTMQFYASGEKMRQLDRIKKLSNDFA